MSVKCDACGALHFKQEKVAGKSTFYDCCCHGRVYIDQAAPFPELLKRLFLRQDSRWRHFQDKIRSLNSSLSFASINCQRVTEVRQRSETVPYVFRLQGKIYVLFNTGAHPPEELSGYGGRKYGQLYIVDADEAERHRQEVQANDGVDSGLRCDLDRMIREVSPHARAFQMMSEVEASERERLASLGRADDPLPDIQMIFNTNGVDLRCYNPPAANEVAAVFVQNPDGFIPPQDLVVKLRGGEMRRISSLDQHVDALTYPLFNPTGRLGWTKELPYAKTLPGDKRKYVSRREYLCYMLADREGIFNPIHYGERLTQEYVVVNYARMESDRLMWLSDNQAQLRAGQYSVQVQARQVAEELNVDFEAVKILPSSHPGSPRYMSKLYQDAMAIVRRYGRPDVFLTITCNLAWVEVGDNCELAGPESGVKIKVSPGNRPTIMSRVFHFKKVALLKEIREGLFGTPVAHVHVVEYQKRGLPHAHFLISLADGCKLNTPERVDSMMSAEIPDEAADPELYALVKKHMIHGPCHNGNWSPCLKNGACNKRFPKEFCENTVFSDNAYVQLKRPNNGRTVDFGSGRVADNRFVVPYCPYLMRRYNAHINTEIVAGIRAVKYLYKYIYKGLDRADIDITGDCLVINEIENHLNTRYVSPPEAALRILGKPLQGKSHAVVALHVHLPGERLDASESNGVDDHGETEEDDEETLEASTDPYTTDAQAPARERRLLKSMLEAYFKLNEQDSFARTMNYMEIPEHYRWDAKSGRWIRRASSGKQVIGRLHPAAVTKPELCRVRLLLLSVKGAKSFEDLRRDPFNLSLVHPTFGAACMARGLIVTDEEWVMCLAEAAQEQMPYQLRRLFVTILVQNSPASPLELWEQFKDAMAEDYRHRLQDEQAAVDAAYRDIVRQIRQQGMNVATHFPDLPEPRDQPQVGHIDVSEELRRGQAYYSSLTAEQKRAVDRVLALVSDYLAGRWTGPRCIFISGEGGTGKSYCYKAIYHLIRAQNHSVCVMASTGVAATLLPDGKTAHKTFSLPVPLQPDSECSISDHAPPMELLEPVCFLFDEITSANRYGVEAIDRTLRRIRGIPDLPFGGAVFVVGGDWKQTHPILPRAPTSEAVALSLKRSAIWRFFEECHLSINMRARFDPAWVHYLLRIGCGDDFVGDSGEVYLPDDIISNGNLVDEVYSELFNRDMLPTELSQYLVERAIIAPLNETCDHYNEEIVERLPGDIVEHASVDEVSTDTLEQGEYHTTEFLHTLNPAELPPHLLRLKPGVVCMLLRNLRVHEGQSLRYCGVDLFYDCFSHGQLYVALSRVGTSANIRVKLRSDKRTVRNVVCKELL